MRAARNFNLTRDDGSAHSYLKGDEIEPRDLLHWFVMSIHPDHREAGVEAPPAPTHTGPDGDRAESVDEARQAAARAAGFASAKPPEPQKLEPGSGAGPAKPAPEPAKVPAKP